MPQNIIVHTSKPQNKKSYAEKQSEFEEHVRKTNERRKQMGLSGVAQGDTANFLVQKVAKKIQARANAKMATSKIKMMAARIRGPKNNL